MSYCRWRDDSDVYLTQPSDVIRCCHCCLAVPAAANIDHSNLPDWDTKKFSEMVAHLRAHQAAGHKVTQQAFDNLEAHKNEPERGKDRGKDILRVRGAR